MRAQQAALEESARLRSDFRQHRVLLRHRDAVLRALILGHSRQQALLGIAAAAPDDFQVRQCDFGQPHALAAGAAHRHVPSVGLH